MPMRILLFAALAALLTSAGWQCPAAAQSAEPPAGAPTDAPTAPAPVISGSGEVQIEWEVKNRFRLFRREADFQRHIEAGRAGTLLGAEHVLDSSTEGRGWAQAMVGHLCLDVAGNLLDTCDRDGQRENYLVPETHRVAVKLVGAVPPGSTCNWSFDDGTVPPQQVNAACSDTVQPRLRYGKPTIAAVGITRPDNSIDSASAEIEVHDLLIAGLGDSVASGEGNPDKPIELADDSFCFRRFLGTVRSEYFRPSRAGFSAAKACEDSPDTSPAAASDWKRHAASWMSAACHRSLYSYQLRTALALAVENRYIAVTFIPLACTGASIQTGLFGSQGADECPPTGRCAGSVPGQLGQLRSVLEKARKTLPSRALDLVLLTIGANDIQFSGLVADVIMPSGVERVLFSQGGLISSLPTAQRILDRDLPRDFGKLRAALKPLVGGDLSRVVYVSYANPATQGGAPCSGGRDGLDVHPAFNADAGRLRDISEFVTTRFLPRLKAVARCEAGAPCTSPDSERMTFVDAHQAEFASHGVCAHSPEDPVFDRDCFRPDGNSFESDLVAAATAPLTCSRQPSEFLPYAPRARWIRTANDSYFTAMTFPGALPLVMQPSDIHDATWGALSAVYGGAFHPSAEGHAAMADAALPAARAALGFKAPPEVVAQPLPPPPGGEPQQ
jgi:hypothetical protein